jgi:hypothetical protein
MQATQPQDRDRILAEIRDSIGAIELNLQLKAALVGSAVHEAEHTQAVSIIRSSIFTHESCIHNILSCPEAIYVPR